jgi:hypothetical protein
MANEDIIRRAPLAPPNSPTITAADRSRVYDLIGRELNGALNGEASFHPDGMKKGSADLMSNLDGLIGTLASLKEAVNDPTNIFDDALRDLGAFRKSFSGATSNDIEAMWDDPKDPRDSKIRLPDSLTPTTRDNHIIYVDPNPGPYSPPNPLLPKNWLKELRTSLESPGGVETGLGGTGYGVTPQLRSRVVSSVFAGNDPSDQFASPPQPNPALGVYSGKPMRQWIVPPPIWERR